MKPVRSFGKGRLLPDGTILYQKKGWEPPPNLEGYVRDPKDPWHFLPEWPACDFRIKTMFMQKCGAMKLLIVCNHPQAPTRQQEIGIDTCKACPFKKGQNALQITSAEALPVCEQAKSGERVRTENPEGSQAPEASPASGP